MRFPITHNPLPKKVIFCCQGGEKQISIPDHYHRCPLLSVHLLQKKRKKRGERISLREKTICLKEKRISLKENWISLSKRSRFLFAITHCPPLLHSSQREERRCHQNIFHRRRSCQWHQADLCCVTHMQRSEAVVSLGHWNERGSTQLDLSEIELYEQL